LNIVLQGKNHASTAQQALQAVQNIQAIQNQMAQMAQQNAMLLAQRQQASLNDLAAAQQVN
jgi:hypothetical protein